jgi:hypothetical protein
MNYLVIKNSILYLINYVAIIQKLFKMKSIKHKEHKDFTIKI